MGRGTDRRGAPRRRASSRAAGAGRGRRLELAGLRSGMLVAVEDTGRRSGSNAVWLCRCDCGGSRETQATRFNRGEVTSCGCLDRKPGRQKGRGGRKAGRAGLAAPAGSAAEALELILGGQGPWFEGRVRARMGEALWFDSPAALAAAGVDYFGPVARRRRRRAKGSSKGNVAETTDVVWLDLDPPPGLPLDEASLVGHAGKQLDLLRLSGLPPSVYVFSGRGSWAYWKLARPVSQAEAEALMRRLYAQFRPGGSEHDVGRVARMPGSVNEKTGLEAFVLALDPDARWDPDRIAALLPPAEPERPDGGRPKRSATIDLDLGPSGTLPPLALPPYLADYLAARPPKAERARLGLNGSALEQSIVARLVNQGCSDGQIALFFDHHRLPRHEEEKPRRGYRWLAISIAKARARRIPAADAEPDTSPDEGEGEEPDGYGPREFTWRGRLFSILREMPEGLRKLELLAWVRDRYSLGRSQSIRDLGRLEDEGLLEARPDPRDGRVKLIHRSEKGRSLLDSSIGRGVPHRLLKGLPKPPAAAAAPSPATDGAAPTDTGAADPQPAANPLIEAAPEPSPAAPAAGAAPAPPRAAASRRRSLEEEQAAARAEDKRRERELINDIHRIHIPGNRWTFLQFLLPLDDWAKVRLHEQLRVGRDDDGIYLRRSFISPKDPALGGPDAHDPVEERTVRDGGYGPSERWIGLAAELVQTPDGFEVATRVERGQTLPNVGLLVQGQKNFYRHLLARRRHQGSVFAVRKRGKGKETDYEFECHAATVDVPQAPPDLDALLDHLADEAEMRAVLDSLPDYWRLLRRDAW